MVDSVHQVNLPRVSIPQILNSRQNFGVKSHHYVMSENLVMRTKVLRDLKEGPRKGRDGSKSHIYI